MPAARSPAAPSSRPAHPAPYPAAPGKATAAPPSPTQLGYLGLGVNDLDAWELFASEILGLEILPREEDGTLLLRMDENHHRFALEPDVRNDLLRIGWELPGSAELAALAARLEAAGTAVRCGDSATVQRRRVVELIQFEDPDGLSCEAYCGPLVHRETPFHSPRPLAGFVAGQLGLGHIVLAVESLDRSLAFYRDVLGLRISDWVWPPPTVGTPPAPRIAFMHCNPRHHSLAFWQRPGDGKRLHHFMLQAARLDDVGLTYDLCQERDVPISLSFGRHTNDQMLSFYMRSPSGFDVEFGWGAKEIDDATWRVQMHATGSVWGHRRLRLRAGVPRVQSS